MNFKSVGYVLGWIMKVEGLFLLLPFVTALIYQEENWSIYLGCAAFSFFMGTICLREQTSVLPLSCLCYIHTHVCAQTHF